MKELGIVRKIDELGRVVIPKEIRRTKQWDTGTPIEMFTDGDDLVLREYEQDNKKNVAIENLELLKAEANGNDELEQLVDEVLNYVKG